VLAIIHILLVPESPAWLVTKGKLKEARGALIRLRGPGHNYEEELQYLLRSYAFVKDRPFSIMASLKRLTDPDVWKPFVIVNIMFVFQMWCRFAFMDNYILVIFSASGVSFDRYTVATAVGILKVLGQVNGTFCLLRFGRRPLYARS
jgi:SP family facilitated glucose transporter-like MFS transporter 8